MTLALEAAWQEAETEGRHESTSCAALRRIMALKIMVAVKDGERDLGCLTRLALEAISDIH
jgi:hypothetical protein